MKKIILFSFIFVTCFLFSQENKNKTIFDSCNKNPNNLCVLLKVTEEIQNQYIKYRDTSNIKYDSKKVDLKFTILKDGILDLDTIIGDINNFKPIIEKLFQKFPAVIPENINGKTKDVEMKTSFYLFSIVKKEAKEIFVLDSLATELPKFPNCIGIQISKSKDCFDNEIKEHVRKNFKYPKKAYKKNINGVVYVELLIDEKGNSIIKAKGPHKLLEKEAIRIMCLLPKFEPAIKNGKPTSITYLIPITFKLLKP